MRPQFYQCKGGNICTAEDKLFPLPFAQPAFTSLSAPKLTTRRTGGLMRRVSESDDKILFTPLPYMHT